MIMTRDPRDDRPLPYDQHGHRATVQHTLCDAPQQQVADAADSSRPDDHRVRVRCGYRGEEVAERGPSRHHDTDTPSATFELGCCAIELFSRCRDSLEVHASDFSSNCPTDRRWGEGVRRQCELLYGPE
jgi:hypothetical protein